MKQHLRFTNYLGTITSETRVQETFCGRRIHFAYTYPRNMSMQWRVSKDACGNCLRVYWAN